MRAFYVGTRGVVQVETPAGNRGDGDTYNEPVPLRGNVSGGRTLRRNVSGDTVVDPYTVQFDHTADVPVGSRLTLPDGQTAIVQASAIVYGAFSVPHHLEVQAT